jgi:hypothetical protein
MPADKILGRAQHRLSQDATILPSGPGSGLTAG